MYACTYMFAHAVVYFCEKYIHLFYIVHIRHIEILSVCCCLFVCLYYFYETSVLFKNEFSSFLMLLSKTISK